MHNLYSKDILLSIAPVLGTTCITPPSLAIQNTTPDVLDREGYVVWSEYSADACLSVEQRSGQPKI